MEKRTITCNNSPMVHAMSNPLLQHTLSWTQVDVFAENPLEGNMLAIFHDARDLTTDQMQALARETNLSETTFILPDTEEEERQHGVRVRIFTPYEELPFAGHPTLGTASWIYWNHPVFRHASEISLRLGVGTIPIRFSQPAPGEVGVVGEMHQKDAVMGSQLARSEVAAVIGCEEQDLHQDFIPQTVSTGLPMCITVLREPQLLRKVRLQEDATACLERIGAKFFYFLAPSEQGEWRARMPFHGSDDPATGSACGCAISYLVHHGVVASGVTTIFRQGIEVHRPSVLRASAELRGLDPVQVRVGGRTIPVATGQFFLK